MDSDHWAFINIGELNPVWPGHESYPWANTGSAPYSVAPVWLGEFGTANATADLYSTVRARRDSGSPIS